MSCLILAVASLFHVDAYSVGPGSGGGGDPYVMDFVNTATTEVLPWLAVHGAELPTPISATEFKKYINPKLVFVLDDVYESCDGTKRGRASVGCYNATEGRWYLSRHFYPLDVVGSAMKRNFIMHEIFRSMGVEGDNYEQTRTISRSQAISSKMQNCLIRLQGSIYNGGAGLGFYQALQACEISGTDSNIQDCVVRLRQSVYSDGAGLDEDTAVLSCQRSGGEPKFQNCVALLRHPLSSDGAGLSSEGAVKACEKSGADEQYRDCVVRLRLPLYRGGAGLDEDTAISTCRAP